MIIKISYYGIILIVLFIFFTPDFLYSETSDTTFSANLNNDNILDIVSVKFMMDTSNIESMGCYVIKINDLTYIDSSFADFEFEVKVMDINKDDVFNEIFIQSGMNDYNNYNVFRFTGKNIFKLGEVFGIDTINVPSNGKIFARAWMGFWYYDFYYTLNPDKMILEKKEKDMYDIKTYSDMEQYPIVVESAFVTYKERVDNSDVKFKTRKGEKIKLLKAYINVKCDGEDTSFCFWYLIQNSKGEKGWARMRDFYDRVSGIQWAG